MTSAWSKSWVELSFKKITQCYSESFKKKQICLSQDMDLSNTGSPWNKHLQQKTK